MSAVTVIVTIDHNQIDLIERIAERLTDAGMSVSHTMPALGMISGTASQAILDTLNRVDGVSEIRRDRSFALPPNDDLTPQ